ncbi:MAG TPA: hypothetical protein VKA67_09845, partial [Verrucomicrobiae bacterium]|nr:hypothetical protein [Verrucomicrobiae bacterium]
RGRFCKRLAIPKSHGSPNRCGDSSVFVDYRDNTEDLQAMLQRDKLDRKATKQAYDGQVKSGRTKNSNSTGAIYE